MHPNFTMVVNDNGRLMRVVREGREPKPQPNNEFPTNRVSKMSVTSDDCTAYMLILFYRYSSFLVAYTVGLTPVILYTKARSESPIFTVTSTTHLRNNDICKQFHTIRARTNKFRKSFIILTVSTSTHTLCSKKTCDHIFDDKLK